MFNNEWDKGKNMSDSEQKDIAVLSQRMTDHAERLEKLEKSMEAIQELKTSVAILVAKFSNFQPNCPLHQLKMDGFESRLVKMESSVDEMWKKILVWSGVASVVLFLIVQLVIPYLVNNLNIEVKRPVTAQVE